MADILDCVFLFWFGLTLAVYAIGSLYEKQRGGGVQKSASLTEAWRDPWAPPPPADSFGFGAYSTQPQPQPPPPVPSHSYSNQTHNNLSSQQQQQDAVSPVSSSSHSEASRWTSLDQHYSSQECPRQVEQQNEDTLEMHCEIPTASGFNADCVEWVNSILFLFYSQASKYGPIIEESVCRSLNEKLSNIMSSDMGQGQMMVEFVRINRQLSSRAELTNIRTETESDKSVSAVCKIYNQTLVFDLSIQRLAANTFDNVAHYELTLEKLEGKLKSVAMLNDKLLVCQFMEKPECKILLRKRHNSLPGQLMNEDHLVSLVLQTLTQVVVDLYFGDDPDFPHYKHQSLYRQRLQQLKGSASEIKRQIKQDFFGALSSNHQHHEPKERKIFIKILKAKNINYNQNVTCLLELDAPYQQALSSTKPGSSNPYWDEHFLFLMGPKSQELVLELWDSINVGCLAEASTSAPGSPQQPPKRRFFGSSSQSQQQQQEQQQQHQHQQRLWSKSELTSGAKFLGLARVNVEALRRKPVQKASLALEASGSQKSNNNNSQRLNEATTTNLDELSNSVGGELQVELLFLEHSAGPSNNGGGAGACGTLDSLQSERSLKKSSSLNSIGLQQQSGDVVSVERKVTPAGYVITTTTITKPKRRRAHDQLSVGRNQSPVSRSSASELADLEPNSYDLADLQRSSQHQFGPNEQQLEGERQSRSRSRSRSRSFLRAIKKRFSFSRQRSRSVGGEQGERKGSARGSPSQQLHDAYSVDSRSRASSVGSQAAPGSRARSVPASRDPSEVPTIVINRGRLSETGSAFTFAHPKSQLVIECQEPRLAGGDGPQSRPHYRYYALAEDAANKAKWRKRGTKLHLFNEHQFVACHLAGSSTCHLCGRVFSRRPGKQGYKCRNCHLLSHKQCHVKVDHQCPYAQPDGLQLEYIDAEPPAALAAEAAAGASATLPRQTHQARPGLAAKSISVDVDDR